MSLNLRDSRIILSFKSFVRSRTIGDLDIIIEVEDSYKKMISTILWVDSSYPLLMGHPNVQPNHG